MDISAVSNSSPTPSIQGKTRAAPPVQAFADLINQAVDQVNSIQQNADVMAQKLAAGDPVDLHDVAMAISQSQIALELSVQVRNKLIEAYQEIMRMQV